jgi:uncharacterized lipoprotein YmbA
MINRVTFQIMIVMLCSVLTVFGGCASSTKPSKFYVLSAIPQSETATQTTTDNVDMLIGIGPITLPAYLNRSQIVTRTSENELNLAEFHLWAEPLKDNISRVLMESLSGMLNTNQIAIYPWRTSSRIAYQVTLDVIRFDVGFDGNAMLNVYWTIFGKDGKEALLTKKSVFSASEGSKNYKAIVAAQSLTLIEFSREIASTIKKIHPR